MSTRHLLMQSGTIVCVAVVLSGCGGGSPPPASGKAAKPTFVQLHIPNPTGGWGAFSMNLPPFEVLPTRGRAVRILFNAPGGSMFNVSLAEPSGTVTALTQTSGTPPGGVPDAGFFSIVNQNVNTNPAVYTMYVRAPVTLVDPTRFDINVVNKSFQTNILNSDPMIVRLGQRKVFDVTVTVLGNGRVTSNPGGITCGTGPSGQQLTNCSFTFGQGLVSLAAQSDPMATRFVGWTGNCAPGVQVCQMTLDGSAAQSATATFAPRTSTMEASTCAQAALIPGLRWIDTPQCAPFTSVGAILRCDSAGFFCCEPVTGGTSARCGGSNRREFPADCIHRAPNGMLRQPGGCYEIAAK